MACVDLSVGKNGNRERRLTNKYQELILDELLKVLEKRLGQQKNEAQTDFSSTFVPYYDSIIDKKFRNLLGEIKVDELTKAMVEQHNYRLRA